MQLDFANGGADDDDFQPVELTIVPLGAATTPSQASQLYKAIATCSNLHPDPNADGDDDDEDDNFDRIVFEGNAEYEAMDGFPGILRGSATDGLPPPMPGSGGWITAENMHEFFDEDGNFLGRGGEDGDAAEGDELGEGAGRTRARDEVEHDGTNGDATDPENKRPRVD